ncbi:MAG: sigma-54-dependent Fis family transcriptional regulator, partial [Myxococcales bacterium]|nr:sigma-54-dependent Fis family transcriptional regulator [Myxococcales bacterium]
FGHRERALRFARVSLAIAEEKDIPPLRAYNHSVLIDIAMDHGDVELARTHLHRLLQQTEASSDRYIRIDRMLAQAKAALTEANYGAAVEALRGLEGEEREGIEPLVLIGGALQAHALAEMRRYDESASQLDELLPIAQRLGRLEHLWFVHYLSGRCREASSGGLAATEAYKAARAALVELRDRVPEEFRVHFFKPLLRHDAWERLERATPRTQSFHGEEEIEGAFLNYRQFKRFMEINSRLNIERNSEKLLELILDTVIDLTGAERGFLIVRDNGKIRVPVARNIDQETIKRQQFKISRSIAEKVLESGEPLLSVDAQSDARLEDFSSVHELRLRSILCFPLRIKSDVKGAIYIDNRFQYRAFNDRDLMVLSAFGDQAGIAIHNAELMEANLTKQKQLEEAMRQVEELNKKLAETVELKSQRLDEITTILSSHAQTIREAHSFHNIISKNAKMQEVFRIVTRVAELDIPVYIYGESGTGKELVAKAIHFAGNRPLDKFISVNCGSIPENLLESELFGHVKGSFTGAYYDKQGLFSLANNGTLFLDEIGDMPLNMQVKLLRVLQDKRFRQVGGTRELSTNARIISASNKNLLQLVNDGTFRQDLFFRLNVVQIDLPALRERREDIPLLVETFMKRECGARSKAIARDALRALTIHDWPGNVRELENEVSRAVALSGETIALADLSPTLLRETKGRTRVSASAPDGDLKQTVQTLERDMLVKTLRETRGSVTKTAKQLGLSRMGVYKKMAKFGLSREMFRS